MAHSHLRAITAKAKKIRKAHPSMKWTSAIREASRLLKRKSPNRRSMGSVKRKRPSRSKTVRKIKKIHAAEGRAIKSLGSVSSHIAHAKAQLKEQIGWAEAQKFAAPKKVTKRKIGKRIAVMKSKYRKLC